MSSANQKQEFTARLSLARADPEAYCRMMIAAVEHRPVHPHAMHTLIFESLSCCKAAGKSCVLVLPPESGKTTVMAFWLAWLRSMCPALRIGITAGDEGRAKKTMFLIRTTLLSPEHQAMFPGIRPDTSRSMSRGEWSASRLYLEGDSAPSFEMFPFEGHAEGARVDVMYLDDVVGKSCKTSQADRERIHGVIHGTWLNRITGAGIAIFTNNVWHREDPIHKLAQSNSFHTLWLGYSGTESIYWRVNAPAAGWERGENGELPLWEKVWPKTRLEAKLEADRYFYKQMFGGKAMLAEECRFPPMNEWKRYSEDELKHAIGAGGRVYAYLDPSGGRSVKKGDFAAIALVLALPDKTLYLLDVKCWRALPEDQARMLWTLNKAVARMPGLAGITQAQVEVLPNNEAWIWPSIKRLMDEERQAGNSLHVKADPPREAKESRIDGVVAHVVNGWLRFPWDMEERMKLRAGDWREFVNQMEDFPLGDHDDGPDALAGAVTLAEKGGAWAKPGQNARDSQVEAIQAKFIEDAKVNAAWKPPSWDAWGRDVSKIEQKADWAL